MNLYSVIFDYLWGGEKGGGVWNSTEDVQGYIKVGSQAP